MIIAVSRDEYLEGIVDAFLQGCDSVYDCFDIEDSEYDLIQTYQLGDDLTQDEIDEVIREMEINLLDDDYGSGKDYDLIYNLVDAMIDDDWEDEFEITRMRGY